MSNKLPPFYFQWHFTNECNLNCKHCYQASFTDDENISLQNSLKIAEIMSDACLKWKVEGEIAITGGEPFLKRDTLYALLDFLEDAKGIHRIFILSNGLIINADDIKKIKSYKKVKAIQVSMEGHTPEIHESIRGKNTFERTIKAIQLLVENDIPVGVMMTASKLNYRYVQEVYALMKTLGVSFFSVDRYVPEKADDAMRLTSKEMKAAFTSIKKIKDKTKPLFTTNRPLYCLIKKDMVARCYIGESGVTVLADGTVFPCRRLPINLGNILTDGLYKIWYTNDLLWDLRDKNNLKGKCHGCSNINVCSGCRAMAYAVNGDYLAEDPVCWRE